MVKTCVILAESPSALVELCGISILERLLRSLQRCGLKRAIVLSSTPELIARELAKPSWARAEFEVTLRSRVIGSVLMEHVVDLWPDSAELLLIVPSDAVFDQRLLQILISRDEPAALVDSAVPIRLHSLVASAHTTTRGKLCGPALLKRDWSLSRTGPLPEVLCKGLEEQTLTAVDVAAEPVYSASLRRKLRPYWFPAPSPESARLAKRVLLESIQKGSLDLPAIVHGPIETLLISQLCKTSITPNQLTILTNLVAWIATILFATGRLGWGLALALIVGVLDGLDGKQARLKVETTKRGKLEHWFDALFEWSWWISIAYYLQSSGQMPSAYWYLLLLVAAEAIDGLAKGSVLLSFGRLIDELSPFDRFVRLFGGRRNIYIVILTIGFLFGHAAKAFAVMAWWEAFTAAVHVARAGWAIAVKRYEASLSRKLS